MAINVKPLKASHGRAVVLEVGRYSSSLQVFLKLLDFGFPLFPLLGTLSLKPQSLRRHTLFLFSAVMFSASYLTLKNWLKFLKFADTET